MKKITGQLIVKFDHNLETDEMVCKCGIEAKEITWDTIFRAYIALGGYINKAHVLRRYGIKTDEDNKAVYERFKAEMAKEVKE